MRVAISENQRHSLKRRLARAFRRAGKVPIKMLLRLQGQDNEEPILLEHFNAIYFPIPRIASTSLKTQFKKELGLPGPAPHATRFPAPDRDKLEAGFYSDYFKFCFVRNPWARLVSCYQRLLNKRNINQTYWTKFLFYFMPKSSNSGRHRLAALPVLNGYMSFNEFVSAVANIPDEYANKHFRSQYTFLYNARGKLLVDYIGHLETFDADFQHVARRVGLSGEIPQDRPRPKRRSYKDYYDKDTWEIVAQRYQKDIEILGYEECQL